MTTTTRDPWQGSNVRRARAYVAANLMPGICAQCHRPVTNADEWVVGHTIPRWARPDLTLEPGNWRPEHRSCSDRSSHAERRAMTDAARLAVAAGLTDPETPFLSHTHDPDSPGPARLSPRGPGGAVVEERGPVSRPEDFAEVPWLTDLLPVPENATWPRHMTPVRSDVVGSLGPEVEEWARLEQKVELRWWQRLAMRRQLEFDADERLVWKVVVESGPRRIGKSVRLRVGATWRLEQQPRFGEPQLVMHTAKDLAIAREVQWRAWSWAEDRWGAKAVTRANGKEAVAFGDNRWLLRALTAVYGYDVTLGYIDEAWAVPSSVFDEGLEPATMERVSPQLVLTSTAHRKATSLMRRQITSALASMGESSSRMLLLLWCAPPGADIGDPATWRAASPHWSEDREELIRDKYERAMRGEADPEADDPDPIEGFRAQYLNEWPPAKEKRQKGEAAVDAAAWAALESDFQESPGPYVVAVESWFASGVSVASAARAGRRVEVTVATFPTIEAAADYVDLLAPDTDALLVGKSLAKHPRFEGSEPFVASVRETVEQLGKLITSRAFLHDGGEELARQVEALRVTDGPEGPRVVSSERADAVKALVQATTRAVNAPSVRFVIR